MPDEIELTPKEEPKSDRARKKKRRKRRRDPLAEKVRSLRNSSQRKIRRRQTVERQTLIVAGVVGGLLGLLILLSLWADWNCPFCINLLIGIAGFSVIVWVLFKIMEVAAMRKYRTARREQKERDGI
ncbi:MAG: hypothetical protein MK081_12440 [Flavobacteriales bacterium]|nr:hypothetical protein [Flavobacteriales bacterium]